MRRPLAALILAGSLLALAGCTGGTDPATKVTNLSAQLNAHGHTTGEPATWWWEYDTVQSELGTANDTEVCGNGTGPKEPDNRCGPASYESGDIPLNVVVTGLTPNTTYYFRACGQDQSWSAGACGSVKSFTTLAGTSYAFDRKWGSSGSGNGQFIRPKGIAVDSSNNVYVADEGNDRIQKFSSTGAFITKWGTTGTGDGQFNFPAGVAVDLSGNVYVADTHNHRIQKFSSTGAFITKWGTFGEGGDGEFDPPAGDGQFSAPAGVGISRQFRGGLVIDSVYVADTGNHRIQRFGTDGTFFGKWGSLSAEIDGYFQSPRGIGANPAGGLVYVADTGNNRIQAFNAVGQFQTKWGALGSGNGQFRAPEGIALDSSSNVYVADSFNGRIQKFSSTGAFITKWGTTGTGDGQFNFPAGVAVDLSGNVYVADPHDHRIQKFKPVQ